MKTSFFQGSLALLLLAGLGFSSVPYSNNSTEAANMRSELLKAWQRSETYTLALAAQMPAEHFQYKAADSVMTYTEQWRHCVIYTCNQLSGMLNRDDSPYLQKDLRPSVKMNKEETLDELRKMYAYVRNVIKTTPDKKLFEQVEFAKDEIPVWRFIYAMENHIIHHRGQCIVYLRRKGIKPQGYYGW
jgi:uncharacterized damage-inducible protein DinB